MPSANARKATDDRSHVNLNGARLSPNTHAKKMPQSEKAGEPAVTGTSNYLDEVTFIRLPQVKAVTGLSKTSLYALIREKSFPAPVRLGPRAVAWVRSEVRQWAVDRVLASRSVA